MTDKLQQTIKEELEKLPKEMQEAISALDWTKVAEEIGKKYLLSDEEINDFQIETLLVLVGLEDGNFYAQNIENNVGTSKDEAEKMAADALQKIFVPINKILIENVKRSGKSRKASWNQTIDFILSGGNYAAFVEPEIQDNKEETPETVLPVFSIKKENVKENFNI